MVFVMQFTKCYYSHKIKDFREASFFRLANKWLSRHASRPSRHIFDELERTEAASIFLLILLGGVVVFNHHMQMHVCTFMLCPILKSVRSPNYIRRSDFNEDEYSESDIRF
jgi:hypothetical protein